ncbi:MAG: hypothetical protein R2681_15740 [Pyrinomonadaceae bacterium]
MADHLVTIEDAREDLLTCAVYLAENIGSGEERAAAIEKIISYFLERADVDTAAEIADSLDDPFVRDRLLAEVVSKCAEVGDDDYAFQLIEAIDEESTKDSGIGKIAVQKAKKGQFDEALTLAADLDHSSDVFGAISVYQAVLSSPLEAEKTLEKVEFASSKSSALQEIAVFQLHNDDAAGAVITLDRALSVADGIGFDEDKFRALLAIAGSYTEAGEGAKAAAALSAARGVVEGIDGGHADNLFVNIAIGYLKAGDIDEADSTLDLVEDKAQIADCLTGFSQIFRLEGDNEEALESLEEAYAMLKSQTEREIRNTKTRIQIFGAVAKEFAELGKVERALEIAHENPDNQTKNLALTQIAQICTESGETEMAKTSVSGIEPEAQRIPALISISDILTKSDNRDEALEYLVEASDMAAGIEQFVFRCELQCGMVRRFHALGETEAARQLASSALESAREIRGAANRSVAIADLSDIYQQLAYELSEEDKEIIDTLLRTSDW